MAEAVEAHLLAAQVALALKDAAAASPHLLRTARARYRGSAQNRVIGWHAAALRAEAAGSRRALFQACERGLQVIDAYQLTLGAVEMRAAATAHGTALTEIAVRAALTTDDPALLLRWTERWRARTFAIPPARPPDDDEFAAKLAMLRQIMRQISQARVEERPVAALERNGGASKTRYEVTCYERPAARRKPTPSISTWTGFWRHSGKPGSWKSSISMAAYMFSSRRQQAFAITSPARGTLPYARTNPAASYCDGSPIARCRIR